MTAGTPPPDPFERQLRETVQQSAQDVSPAVARRLRHARQRALASAPPRRSRHRQWLTAGAIAAGIAVLGVTVMLRGSDRPLGPATAQPIMADLDVLADDDELELLEDLEFYAWLAGQDDVT